MWCSGATYWDIISWFRFTRSLFIVRFHWCCRLIAIIHDQALVVDEESGCSSPQVVKFSVTLGSLPFISDSYVQGEVVLSWCRWLVQPWRDVEEDQMKVLVRRASSLGWYGFVSTYGHHHLLASSQGASCWQSHGQHLCHLLLLLHQIQLLLGVVCWSSPSPHSWWLRGCGCSARLAWCCPRGLWQLLKGLRQLELVWGVLVLLEEELFHVQSSRRRSLGHWLQALSLWP